MPFTNRNIVLTHLMASALPESAFENVPITLTGTADAQLPHANILDESIALKCSSDEKATRLSGVVLTNYDETSLSHSHIVPQSLVVAGDDSLSTVFVEEKDYLVNEHDGKISRLPGTAITSGASLVVWYDYFTLYELSTDYRVNYENGTVSRTSGSAIPDGATVLADYSVAEGSADALLIDEAIIEAEDMIARCLREGYTVNSTDVGLRTGATYLSLSIFARGMAALTLTTFRGSDAAARAKEWQAAAENWWKLAWDTLAPFTLPHSLRSPLAL